MNGGNDRWCKVGYAVSKVTIRISVGHMLGQVPAAINLDRIVVAWRDLSPGAQRA